MKKLVRISQIVPLAIAALAFVQQGCIKVKENRMLYLPIYMSHEDLDLTINSSAPRPVEHEGKVVLYGNYLLVVDEMEGVHVIDNSDPSAPVNISYMNVLGVQDITVDQGVMYANNYSDLVSIDISDPTQISPLARTTNVLAPVIPATPDNEYPADPVFEALGQVVGWKLERVEREYKGLQGLFNKGHFYRMDPGTQEVETIIYDPSMDGISEDKAIMASALSGSMASMAFYQDQVYTIQDGDIHVFSVGAQNECTAGAVVQTSDWAETVFIRDQYLFSGTVSGMSVFGLSNPSQPDFISEFSHAVSCDPVVVQGSYAYVTLRSGNRCWGTSNQLDVINVQDMHNPTLELTMQMTNPHGLAIDGNTLIICDGSSGLKIYDASDVNNLFSSLLYHYPGIKAVDVIARSGVAIVTAEDGIYQFDYSQPQAVSLLSKL